MKRAFHTISGSSGAKFQNKNILNNHKSNLPCASFKSALTALSSGPNEAPRSHLIDSDSHNYFKKQAKSKRKIS